MSKVYWAPSKNWEVCGTEILIDGHAYGSKIVEMFPNFYYTACNGFTLREMLKVFPGIDAIFLRSFINELLAKQILVHSIEDAFGLFSSQTKLFTEYNEYLGSSVYDEKIHRELLEKALRRKVVDTDIAIRLAHIPVVEELKRCSTRVFDKKMVISFERFSSLLAILREYKVDGSQKYCYSSAGGLYPIDFYLYIKPDRVVSLEEGIYAYVPYENVLKPINLACNDIKDAHYFDNRDIYNCSAFSIFFFFNAVASMPKYGGLAYMLGLLDAGAAMHALNAYSTICGLGSCSIGDMNFSKIAPYFRLNVNQKFIHCMEFGIPLQGGSTLDKK